MGLKSRELSDQEWAILAPFMPEQKGPGHPWKDHRLGCLKNRILGIFISSIFGTIDNAGISNSKFGGSFKKCKQTIHFLIIL